MVEGDDFHSPANLAKMKAGQPLSDADRSGWLDQLAALLIDTSIVDTSAGSDATSDPIDGTPEPVPAISRAVGPVLTCSALRKTYRDRLRAARSGLWFVFLRLTYEEAFARVSGRLNHPFKAELVASQFETLESPEGEAGVITVDASAPLEDVVANVLRQLAELGKNSGR